MQSYSVVSLTLLMVTAIVMAYAYSPNITAAPRTALLTNAKPRITTARQQQVSSAATASPTASRTASFSSISTQAAAGKISNVVFASGINDNFEPVGARTVFGEGDFRLYATFDYADMEDGTTWQWVWRQNGQVVDGGEEVWNYGSDGPGWVYLQPENGFAEGDYSLEVYVGGQLQSQAAAEISASVANQ